MKISEKTINTKLRKEMILKIYSWYPNILANILFKYTQTRGAD